ncbi:MAG: hypothetical protein JXA69_15095 [Phycisphaerae bacterium]|nr:hypothetical protein [Phycisphaerae bacterium]
MEPDKQDKPETATTDPVVADLLGREVVIDTAGMIVYLGTLRADRPGGFWLENADVHNCNDGHAQKDEYIVESRLHGIHVNRRRVFVLRQAAISLSALADIVAD